MENVFLYQSGLIKNQLVHFLHKFKRKVFAKSNDKFHTIIWTLLWRSGIGCLPKSPLNFVNGRQMFYIYTFAVFANPKDDSSVNQIYQTFGGRDCYPTLEEKAAMLLYFVVKNHGVSDLWLQSVARLKIIFSD